VVPSFFIANLVPTLDPRSEFRRPAISSTIYLDARRATPFSLAGNFRVIENDRISSNLPNYSFSRNTP
jgi:hypothetical protein